MASSRWCQIVVALIGASLREEKKERFSFRETAIVKFVGKLWTSTLTSEMSTFLIAQEQGRMRTYKNAGITKTLAICHTKEHTKNQSKAQPPVLPEQRRYGVRYLRYSIW